MARLTPQEQLKLVARIGERLSETLPIGEAVGPACPGSPSAIRKVVLDSPRLSKEAVDELERAIACGVLPVKEAGTFDNHG